MKPEDQRIAIAEACRWKIEWPENWEQRRVTGPNGRDTTRPTDPRIGLGWMLPDYLNDLNAMHEAEKVLKDNEQQADYAQHLIEVLNRDHHGEYRFLGASQFRQIHATAAQRAEALLRTLGKWVDEPVQMRGA